VKNTSQLKQSNLIFRPVYIDFELSFCGDTGYLVVGTAIIWLMEPIEDAIKWRSIMGNEWISTDDVV
jgi:hypothetical protein